MPEKACPIMEGKMVALGQQTMSTGGGVQVITITGLKSTDYAFVQMVTNDTGTTMVPLRAACTANTLTITRNDDGSSQDDGVVNYMVIRPY